jgi:hypothetical protein
MDIGRPLSPPSCGLRLIGSVFGCVALQFLLFFSCQFLFRKHFKRLSWFFYPMAAIPPSGLPLNMSPEMPYPAWSVQAAIHELIDMPWPSFWRLPALLLHRIRPLPMSVITVGPTISFADSSNR